MLGGRTDSCIVSNKNAVCLRGVFEQDIVQRSLWQSIDRPYDIPAATSQTVDYLLANAGIRKKRKRRH
jgi:hypothetical protein